MFMYYTTVMMLLWTTLKLILCTSVVDVHIMVTFAHAQDDVLHFQIVYPGETGINLLVDVQVVICFCACTMVDAMVLPDSCEYNSLVPRLPHFG